MTTMMIHLPQEDQIMEMMVIAMLTTWCSRKLPLPQYLPLLLGLVLISNKLAFLMICLVVLVIFLILTSTLAMVAMTTTMAMMMAVSALVFSITVVPTATRIRSLSRLSPTEPIHHFLLDMSLHLLPLLRLLLNQVLPL
ncbi:hypothetical protein FB192DRAFT_1382370 [Mucor lusitanicus]|uniref:Uncharacterized protein n=1 Tax=Mucor circinelloides f. lusitanicus TaxID=29924 RepID=A0A8H4BEX5_MUCCL|nr:hypothetical protein FB192DRAFT_1382370 [Mucor lusitanicus]